MVGPSVPLTAAEIKELQEIVGVFLFYSRAVDPTMLTAINKIASRQAKPTSLIKQEVEHFLQYANKWPNATMRVRASNMKLVCHSDGSYLSESKHDQGLVVCYSWETVKTMMLQMRRFVSLVLSLKQ